MQITNLIKIFDKLDITYGDKNLDTIYGAGCIYS